MKNLFILFLFLLPLCGMAQSTHTVGPKESLFSIGRLYNVHPRELASFNNIPFETGLTIGQVLKIPGKKTMTPVPETAGKTEPKAQPAKPVAVEKKALNNSPVYHTVAKKEGLYGISKKYNVTVDEIKKWNRLTSDGLTEGMNLIVGYGAATGKPEVAAVPEKKEPVVAVAEVKAQPVEQPKQAVTKTTATDANNRTAKNFSGGVFRSMYMEQVANKLITDDKGTAGVFKSTSGWEDGKYYCLHNAAPAGSYIKITNTATQKSVYAKVLDLIPDLKQNTGLVIRISNAAAAELGATAPTFDCTLHF